MCFSLGTKIKQAILQSYILDCTTSASAPLHLLGAEQPKCHCLQVHTGHCCMDRPSQQHHHGSGPPSQPPAPMNTPQQALCTAKGRCSADEQLQTHPTRCSELHSSPKLAASMPALQCTPGFHITDNAQLLRFPIQVSQSPPCSTDTPPGCALPHHAVTRQRIPQIKAFTFPTVREQGDRGQQYRHPALFPLLPSTKPFPNSSCHPPHPLPFPNLIQTQLNYKIIHHCK